MVFPVRWRPPVGTPSRSRFSAASLVGAKWRVEIESATFLLISSGMVMFQLLSPASMWANGTRHLIEVRAAAATVLVSPSAATIDGP
jgi:hypothetical protein